MRITWDSKKSKLLKADSKRNTSFEDAAILISNVPSQLGSQLLSDDPEQYFTIGFASNGALISLVYEFRNDEEGEYIHLVTLWKTTTEEKRRFGL